MQFAKAEFFIVTGYNFFPEDVITILEFLLNTTVSRFLHPLKALSPTVLISFLKFISFSPLQL